MAMTNLPATETLDLEADGPWLTVWFNTPENRNALTNQRAGELLALANALKQADDIRGIAFRGRGGMFCAGGDLKGFAGLVAAGDREAIASLSREAGALFDAVDTLPQLTVMAVEGAAMAGGMGLACCGDVVLATADAKFGLSEVRLGLSPAQIAPFVLRRLGAAAGRRLMLTGSRLDAEAALAAGLVDRIAADSAALDEALGALKRELLGCAPQAVAGTKQLIAELPRLDRAGQIEAAARNFADRLTGAEAQEGVAAFIGKRKPAWAEPETSKTATKGAIKGD